MTALNNSFIVTNARIVLEDEIAEGYLIVDSGTIAEVGRGKDIPPGREDWSVVDGKGGLLLPGFIDIHVHGGFGGDFMNADRESYDLITSFHAKHGTTAMLATTMTASKEAIEAVLAAVADYAKQDMAYTPLIGVHLEGPFISEKWPGAQNPAYIHDPQLPWLEQWCEQYPGLIKLLTLAPEKHGARKTIAWLAGQGIIASAGHTDALYDEVIAAADAGLSHAVHTYNAMRGLHHRQPGTLGAVLTDDRIHAELIADGEHVHPAAIKLMLAAKPKDRVILITDAIEAAGMPDGDYELGGLAVNVKGGTARLTEGGALAGSSLTMIAAFRYMLDGGFGLSVGDVSRMASGNAARELGIFDRTGSIAAGKQADLVLLDDALQVTNTWVRGRLVFEAE